MCLNVKINYPKRVYYFDGCLFYLYFAFFIPVQRENIKKNTQRLPKSRTPDDKNQTHCHSSLIMIDIFKVKNHRAK